MIFLLNLLFVAQQLRLSTDVAATVEIDGRPAGLVVPGKPLVVALDAGEHQVVAAAPPGEPWRKLLLITAGEPAEVTIPLRAHLLRAQVERQGYWLDGQTNLMWVSTDSGSGLTARQAHGYCQQLAVSGNRDWRLPGIDELQTLFGGTADERGFRVIAPLKLSGWAWSATPGNEAAESWALDFGDGAWASVAAGDAGLNRALCVRQSQR